MTKAPVTLGTLQGSPTTVNLHVSIQTSQGTKAFVALSTFEGFHATVYHYRHVTWQMD